jgi:hypothetical protein
MKIPSNNVWTQTNEGDTSGVLHSTRNITLDTPGKLRLSQKSIAIENTDSLLEAGYGLSLAYFNNQWISVQDAGVRDFDLLGTATSGTGSDPTPSIYGDGMVFNSLLLVTTTDNLSSWNGSAWTNSLASLTTTVPHPMEVFDSLPTYKLAIGNGNTVKIYDTGYNASSTVLTLPTQYIVTSLAYNSGYLYVGTRNTKGGQAAIFIWDGSGTNANYQVVISGNWVYSVKPYGSSVCAITSSGELIYVSGTTATRLAALPVFYLPDVNWQGTTDSNIPRVFNRGMVTDGDLIYINVNALVETGQSQDYLPGFESGIWVFDPQNGLYHRASTNYLDKYVIDSTLGLSNSVITTSTAHKLKTGDSVIFQTVGGITGVSTQTVYYVSVLSTTTIKLASSRRALQDGTFLTLSGTPTASDKLVYTPNQEYFQYARVSSGAVSLIPADAQYFKNWSTPIIWHASAQDYDIDERFYAINILTDSYNVGFFETQRIYSENIEQSWKKLTTFLDGLNLSNEEILIKYRTEEEHGYPTRAILGYWSSTNQISFDALDVSFLEDGDELMILDGGGRGYSVHIVGTPDISSNTVSVTVDENIGVANKPVRVSATNYKKTTVLDLETKIKGYLSSSIDTQSAWVQIKGELRGYGIAINKMDLGTVGHKATQ